MTKVYCITLLIIVIFAKTLLAANETLETAPLSQSLSTIKGTVTDEAGDHLPGVNVTLKGTSLGVITNSAGGFSMDVPDAAGTLVFSSISYKTKEVVIQNSSVINVKMESDDKTLNEVVVVGYGTQKKATLTGAVVAVKGSDLVKSPAINVAASLAGRLPGVIINSRSGEPGRDEPSISIRGRSTTGNSSALVIVDGVERGGLGQINPNDIESISVLKDASAAIYGARAANGVILVTTKRGSASGAPVVNFSYNQGFTGATRNPKMADSYTFFNVYNEVEQGAGRPARYTQEELQKFKAGTDPDYANFNWYDFIVKKWTPQHRSNLSVSGGGNKAQYFLSFGEVAQDGQYKMGSTKIKQYNLRSNVDVQFTENFKVGMNLAVKIDNNHYPFRSSYELNSHIYLYQPNWVPYWPGTDYLTPNRANDNVINFVTDNEGYQSVKATTVQTTLFAKWSIPWITGLSLSGSGSYDPTSTFTKSWQLPNYVYYKNTTGNGYTKGRSGFGVNNPNLTDRSDLSSLLYLTSRLNYDRKFGNHNIAVLLGYEQQSIKGNFVSAYRSDFVSSALPEIFAGSSDKSKQANNGSSTQNARKNYFGRITYDYAAKYLAEVTLRRDGSPNFSASNRWGNFPSASVGYRISEENFFKQFKFVNDLKVRASYGLMGNDLVNSFQYLQTYGLGNNYVVGNNDVTGLVATGVPNPDITWETAKTGNIGVDANLWNGRLGITFDYFKTRRSNILTKRTAIIPGYTGLSLPDENIGIVGNKGFELILSHSDNTHAIRYNLSGNVAFARNKVIFSDEQPAAEPYQLATGRPIGAALYYKAIGIFKDLENVDAYPHFPDARPGDIIYEDLNKDGMLDARDQIRIDQTSTPQITYGFTLNVSYKGFDLSALLQGQGRAKSYFDGYFSTMGYSLGNFLSWRANNRWTPDNTDATMPRAAQEIANNNGVNSTQWLLNAGFLKLKNVEIGYNLPKALVEKVHLKNLRLSISGSNLLNIYDHMKKLGFDPETTAYWYYPPQRVVNFGVNVTL